MDQYIALFDKHSIIFLFQIFTIFLHYVFKFIIYRNDISIYIYIIGAIINIILYSVCDTFLLKYVSSYKTIIDKKNRYYVLGNLFKATALASITPDCIYSLYETIILDIWNKYPIWNAGCIYAIPDLVSMFMVRRMQYSTYIHHICVQLFQLISLSNNYTELNVCRPMYLYAVFSTFSYLVNFLLTTRFLYVDKKLEKFLLKCSLYIYVLCCSINWTIQLYYLYIIFTKNPTIYYYLYYGLISLVIWDDIILIRWLKYKNK